MIPSKPYLIYRKILHLHDTQIPSYIQESPWVYSWACVISANHHWKDFYALVNVRWMTWKLWNNKFSFLIVYCYIPPSNQDKQTQRFPGRSDWEIWVKFEPHTQCVIICEQFSSKPFSSRAVIKGMDGWTLVALQVSVFGLLERLRLYRNLAQGDLVKQAIRGPVMWDTADDHLHCE